MEEARGGASDIKGSVRELGGRTMACLRGREGGEGKRMGFRRMSWIGRQWQRAKRAKETI